MPDDAPNPRLYVLTNAADATLPDLAGTRVRWPAGAAYQWLVGKYFPLESVDEAAGDWFWGFDSGDRGWTGSEVHSFTTKTVAGTALRGPIGSPNAHPAEGLGRPRRSMLPPGLTGNGPER